MIITCFLSASTTWNDAFLPPCTTSIIIKYCYCTTIIRTCSGTNASSVIIIRCTFGEPGTTICATKISQISICTCSINTRCTVATYCAKGRPTSTIIMSKCSDIAAMISASTSNFTFRLIRISRTSRHPCTAICISKYSHSISMICACSIYTSCSNPCT